MKTKKILIIPILLSIIVLVGCVSSNSAKRIKAFSEATVLTTQNTISAFNMVEQNYYETQVAKIVINYDGNGGFSPNSIERFLSPTQIEARIKVLKGIQKYSEKLSQIMGNEQLDEFDEQTKNLGESLTKINDNFVKNNILTKTPFDLGDIQIFTTAVNALGRWFIGHKRQEGVEKSVENMQQHITSICNLLIKDIGTVDPNSGIPNTGLREQSWRLYKDTMKSQDSFILHNRGKLDPISKRNEIKYLVSLLSDQRKADNTLKSVQSALSKLKDTHSKLKEAFSEETLEIDNLIKQLVAEGKRIKEFYKSL